MQRILSSKDFLLGILFIAIGIVYGGYAWFKLPLGTALNMGPGYFPFGLALILIAIGIAVAVRTVDAETPTIDFRALPWRAILLISVSTVVFALLARGAGILIATLVTAIVAAFSARAATWVSAITTAVFLAFFSALVFVYGMQLPLGIFGSWFR